MKCRRVDSTRLELHDSSRQKSTRLTGSQVAKHLELFQDMLEWARVWNVGESTPLDSSCTTRLTGSQVSRQLEIFRYLFERVRV